MALAAAQTAYDLAPDNFLTSLEMADIYDQQGDFRQAVALYETWTGSGRETRLVVNYLKLADELWNSGDKDAAAAVWRDRVLAVDPVNIVANWRLYRYELEKGKSGQVYRDSLAKVLNTGLHLASDSDLIGFQAEAIGSILRSDLWNSQQKKKILAYYAWSSKSPEALPLLEQLTQIIPEDPDIWNYLGDKYWRAG